MATNLISLIMDYLTPEIIGRIASALGLDRNNASAAIGASVPALLAGICGAATQPGGAQKLLDSARQQTGALDKFSSMQPLVDCDGRRHAADLSARVVGRREGKDFRVGSLPHERWYSVPTAKRYRRREPTRRVMT